MEFPFRPISGIPNNPRAYYRHFQILLLFCSVITLSLTILHTSRIRRRSPRFRPSFKDVLGSFTTTPDPFTLWPDNSQFQESKMKEDWKQVEASSAFKQKQLSTIPFPLKESRIADISCTEASHACLMTNVHYFQGSFHLYLGDAFNISDGRVEEWRELHMYSGLGFNSAMFYFVIIDSFISNVSYSSIQSLISISMAENSTLRIPIYVHITDPPTYHDLLELVNSNTNKESSQNTVLCHANPLLVFSVIWENLFRTLYAGMGAWTTALQYKVFFPDYQRIVLVETHRPTRFLDLLQASSSFPITWIEDLESGIYKAIVFGISQDAGISEIDVERHAVVQWGIRALAFRLFTDQVKSSILLNTSSELVQTWRMDFPSKLMAPMDEKSQKVNSGPLHITIIKRQDIPRCILNLDEVIDAIQDFFDKTRSEVIIEVYDFSQLSFHHQLLIIHQTDILIAMHGAALTHTMFMLPNTIVIELFPYRFRKMIYQNLAQVMGVKYVSWTNTRKSDTKFNWEWIESHRFTSRPRNDIVSHEVDWYNMDSKNYWRNQDTKVQPSELIEILKTVLQDQEEQGEVKYLMYMPWEQLNNQLTGFKSACAVASMLNRTLVLPLVGYRIRWLPSAYYQFSESHDKQFQMWDFSWKNFEQYFDASTLASLPCRYISLNNFVSLNRGRDVGPLHWHDLDYRSFTDQQLMDYYSSMAQLPFKSLAYDHHIQYQLSKEEIINFHQSDETRVLSLGSLFRYYDFEMKLSYPIKVYTDYMSHPLYRKITQALEFNSDIKQIASHALQQLKEPLVAIHIRRGDYWIKCKELRDSESFLHCWPSAERMASVLRNLFPSEYFPLLYISTNHPEEILRDHSFIETMAKEGRRLLFQKDMIEVSSEEVPFDSIETSIIDMCICIQAAGFIGNMHSSFTRTIVEKRTDKPAFF